MRKRREKKKAAPFHQLIHEAQTALSRRRLQAAKAT